MPDMQDQNLKPYTPPAKVTAYVTIGILAASGLPMLWLFIIAIRDGDWADMLIFGLWLLLDAGLIAFFWRNRYPIFTITTDGVELYNRRKGSHVHLPWSDYAYMYTLQGYKNNYCLLSDTLMDKPAQYFAVKACRKNTEQPGTANGCLLLAGASHEVKARMPEHIQVVPEWKCCSFWDGYKAL